MDLPAPASLSDRVRTFLERPLYPALGTVGEDAEPHQAVIWYRLESDDRILVNSREGRRWPTELRRDGRASLAVSDLEDPFKWVGLQCVVEEVIDDVDRARDEIVALAERYDDASEPTIARFRSQPRVSFRLRIVSVHEHLDD